MMGMRCPKCQSGNPETSTYCADCGTKLPSSKDIPVTKTLETSKEELTTGSIFAGRYQIIEVLGKGGMGKVYKAIDKKLNEEVALKLIKPEIASDKKTLERFNNELKFARKIAHKNVGRMYELMEEKGTHFITMEYVPGQDLRGLIRQTRQLTVGTAVSIAKQVCEGLTEAHRLGVIHRDLKPQNIMIDKEGMARIMDFGIARSVSGKSITGAGVMIGTPEYMSPEQVESKETDQRSDIYSLGVILYEMITGRVPFEGDTPLSVALKQKTEVPQNPKEFNTQIPEDLCRVVLKCLEKEKQKRYQSASEVRSELENIEKGIPSTERIVSKRRPITSKEITVTFRLKKLLIPAFVIVVLAIITVTVLQLFQQKEAIPNGPGKTSLAVLPFVDMSPEKDQGYLCDGIADTLINSLSNIKDLQVPSRTSAFSFKDKEQDVREIGKKLNVEAVLEGSVQKADNRIRITAQLINVEDGYQLWSERFNRELEDVFTIQDEISLAIVNNLKLKLLGEEKAKLMKHYTDNVEAYNLYLEGLFFWNKRTEEGLKKAMEYFNKAIENDKNYALAYSGLADSYNLLGAYEYLPLDETFPKAKEAALKALEIDDTLSEAYASLAYVEYNYDWDWKGAEENFKRAIDLNPAYATAHHWYALYLSAMGRFDEAIKEIERAHDLDPLSLVINRDVGTIYLSARQYDKAEEAAKKTIEMDPNFAGAHSGLRTVYLYKLMDDEALEEYQKGEALLKESISIEEHVKAMIYARTGKKDEARQILQELIETKQEDSYNLAIICFDLGDIDQGFNWLEKAYEEREMGLFWINVEPEFDRVRTDPRFKALLKKMGLE
jgi:serine/threonine protein kinase/Tfp pilus assembly protein PilF